MRLAMATYTEQMQWIWRMYDEAGMPVPATARDLATWAIGEGHWQPRDADIISQCAEDLARALRDEYRTDAFGRRYRTKHAVRITRGGIQYSLWADIDSAPRPHMERAFAQRRQQIVGDCHQLRIDVDVYNDRHTEDAPIQLVLDFTRDVEELLHLDDDKAA
jgi:hypothetical protein